MERNQSQMDVVITGVGLCSSMGGVVGSCAAARAGMSRAANLDQLVEDDATGVPEPVNGHTAPEISGFIGRARLLALGERALADLFASGNEIRDQKQLRLHLCLTDQDSRRWLPEEPLSQAEVREQERLDQRERDAVATAIAELAELDIQSTNLSVYAKGAASMAAAVVDAATALREGSHDACLVGGVDSLVDASVLQFLHEGGRLKTPDDPAGLIPGEAAAFLLLQRADQARQSKRPVLGHIVAAAQAQGEDPDVVERPPQGSALVDIFSRLFETEGQAAGPFWVLTDQNGETFRAVEWGDFLVRASRTLPGVVTSPVWYPAMSFGDVGAAAGGVSACIAVRAFARGYAAAPTAVVVTSTYEGDRCGLRIERP